jgi:hypothetical protein
VLHLYLITDATGSWPLVHDGPLPEEEGREESRLVALLGRFDRRERALEALDLARQALGTIPGDHTPKERARGCDFALAALYPAAHSARPRRRRSRTSPLRLVR